MTGITLCVQKDQPAAGWRMGCSGVKMALRKPAGACCGHPGLQGCWGATRRDLGSCGVQLVWLAAGPIPCLLRTAAELCWVVKACCYGACPQQNVSLASPESGLSRQAAVYPLSWAWRRATVSAEWMGQQLDVLMWKLVLKLVKILPTCPGRGPTLCWENNHPPSAFRMAFCG